MLKVLRVDQNPPRHTPGCRVCVLVVIVGLLVVYVWANRAVFPKALKPSKPPDRP